MKGHDRAALHRSPWTFLFLGVAAGALVPIVASSLPSEGSRQIASGIAALLLVIANALYGARKWLLVSRLGSLHVWMAGHVGLGAALLVVALWHADLSELGGPGWALVALVGLQVLSGFWALVELSSAPRRFRPVASGDVCFPTTARRRLALLGDGVEALLERRGPALRAWFERYRPVLEGRSTESPPLEGFAPADARVAADLHARVGRIALLHAAIADALPAERAAARWTWIHVPVSVTLVTMVVLHVIGWLVYG
ncbi:MAG: hypothetical protein HYY06_18510 [Deltaproteobacteria bacterium]|nr:hypothetical protein [Deltaproteobacteria bacterium]